MELTEIERSTLMHLHMVLAKLDPENAEHHEVAADILRDGYFRFWKDKCLAFSGEPIDLDVMKFVHSVFDMYRWLQMSYNALSEDEKQTINADRLKFPGFDGNNETDYMGYAQFVRERLDRWREVDVDDYNSHLPSVAIYARMLEQTPPRRGNELLSANLIMQIVETRMPRAAE